MDFSLRVNRKQIATHSSPYRDQQFQYIGSLRTSFQRQGLSIISVDSKKREGSRSYGRMPKLLVLADSGGSNRCTSWTNRGGSTCSRNRRRNSSTGSVISVSSQ
jgi:hypothetical protein